MEPEADANGSSLHDCMKAVALSRLLDADDPDAALQAGLMVFVPCPACDASATTRLLEARQQLARAWAARDRYRARDARLARLAAERDARRAPTQVEKKNSLPPSVAEVLARAKTRAAERTAR